MAILLFKENTCAELLWNPCIYVGVLDQKKLIYLQVWPWPSTYLKNVSNGTSPPQGQQLCYIILKSMHKCKSCGPDKSGWTYTSMHACTHIHLSKIVTAMSLFTASRLNKMNTCAKLFLNQRINVEVMAPTSSIYDHFIIWPSRVTLTFNLPKQRFQMVLLLLKENTCVKLFWNPFINVGLWHGQANLLPFYHLTFKCDLDLQPT